MDEKQKKNRRLKICVAIGFALLFAALMLFLFSGGNLQIVINIFREDMSTEEIREALEGFGIRGYITIGILSMLQVVLTFLPAEPTQVVAGITFGMLEGGLVCLAGVVAGNSLIFVLYKLCGSRLTAWFKSNAEFDFETARHSAKVVLIVFMLYFLPAIPYGLICLFAASLGLKYPKYILLTSLGSIPSILIGVGLGHMAIGANWIVSLCVFVVLVVLLIIINVKKKYFIGKLNNYVKKHKASASFKVRDASPFVCDATAVCTRLHLAGKVKIIFKNNVGKLEHPSIVLVNHGSFMDFVYAGCLIRKERPNFMAARLYTYNKSVRKIMRMAGIFPKSMFSNDFENAKNCLKVISSGNVLTMMPEARLSTVGKFEDIQETTYKFIQKMGVPVYVIKLEGDYFAKPKWGDKIRKGSVVYSTIDILYTKEQIATATEEEIKSRVEEALYYDEFKWLETMPHIHYKSRTLAKGLENVLVKCPECGKKYTMTTKGMTIKCSSCGLTAALDDRYSFVDKKPFDNFATWYEWQKSEMEKEIISNPEFKIESKVTLKHSSIDGSSMLRVAGSGVCTLDKSGLLFRGEDDGEQIEKLFPLKDIYRILFGAGQNFEIYEGKEIWYFVPEEIRCCVDYYVASELLKKHFDN